MIKVELSPDLTDEDVLLLRRYLADSLRFSDREWQRTRNAIERLGHSTVTFGSNLYSFRRFLRHVHQRHLCAPLLA